MSSDARAPRRRVAKIADLKRCEVYPGQHRCDFSVSDADEHPTAPTTISTCSLAEDNLALGDASKPDGTPRKLLHVSNPTWLVPAYRPRGLTYPWYRTSRAIQH